MLDAISRLVQRRPAQVLRLLALLLVVAAIVGAGVLETSLMATSPGIQLGLVRAQVLAGVLSVAVLLVTTGGAVRAAVPAAMGGVGLVLGLGLLRPLAEVTEVAAITPAVVVVLAIVLAVPASLYVVSRFREELAAGYTSEESASRVVQTTGRTILFGAMTVSLAIAGLLVLPSGQLRALALICIAVVLVNALSSVLVLPALLAQLGVRIDRLARHRDGDDDAGWRALTGRGTSPHPVLGLGLAVLLAATAAPFLTSDLASSSDVMMTDSMAMADVGGALPLAAGIVLLGALLVLAVEFGSLLVPAKAVVATLLGLCPALGLLALLADDGNPDLTVTVVLFSLGFGLAIEPLVYVLSRMKEEHDRDGDSRRSISDGLRRSASLLDNAAVVSAVIIIAFTVADALPVRALALGLTVAIATHALLVRPFVLPALMGLGASANWRAPDVLRRAHERLALTAQVSLADPVERPARTRRPARPVAGTRPTPPLRVIGQYRLLDSLGRSHQSETFLAEGPVGRGPERLTVTVFDDISVPADLVKAAAAMGRYGAIRSPHLAVLHEVGLWEGHLYYSAELGGGGSLAAPTEGVGPDVVLRVVADAARGLAALHAAGLHHRDLRPGTVLLREGRGVLAGLGIVQLLAETQRDLSAAGDRSDPHHTPVYDPAYVAPEIAVGGDATVASEVYALGLTLHEAVAGESVYGTVPVEPAARRAHVRTASVTISPALPDVLRTIIARCLAPDPEDRVGSAEEVAAALDMVGEGVAPSTRT